MSIVTAAGRSTDPEVHAAQIMHIAKLGLADTGYHCVVAVIPSEYGDFAWTSTLPNRAAVKAFCKAMLDELEKTDATH